MPSLADAVDLIRAAGLPVLFADTCSLVDVIRAPTRPGELRGCVEAATELLAIATARPPGCLLVAASFVPGELLAHAGPEADNLRAHVARVDQEAEHLHGFCGLVGIVPSFSRPAYGSLPLADRLHDLSRGLLDCALRLDPDQDCIIRAHGRAATYTPPSRKGGEVKDSTILEECLEVSRRLQAAAFGWKLVFCTSNRRDYCEAGSRLHPPLAVEFGAADLGFATSLPWALNEIKKP
jgi:hypothetical protein